MIESNKSKEQPISEIDIDTTGYEKYMRHIKNIYSHYVPIIESKQIINEQTVENCKIINYEPKFEYNVTSDLLTIVVGVDGEFTVESPDVDDDTLTSILVEVYDNGHKGESTIKNITVLKKSDD